MFFIKFIIFRYNKSSETLNISRVIRKCFDPKVKLFFRPDWKLKISGAGWGSPFLGWRICLHPSWVIHSIIFTFEKQELIIEVHNFLKVFKYDFYKNLQKQALYILYRALYNELVLFPLFFFFKKKNFWISYKLILSNSVGKSIFSSSLKNFWNKHIRSSEKQKFIGKKLDKKTFRHSSQININSCSRQKEWQLCVLKAPFSFTATNVCSHKYKILLIIHSYINHKNIVF